MRVDLKKFLFLGVHSDRDAFFETAQHLGVIHFIDSNKKGNSMLPLEVENCLKAIKVLRSFTPSNQIKFSDDAHAIETISKILELKKTSEELQEMIRKMTVDLNLNEPLGNYSLSELAWIESQAQRKIQFFSANRGMAERGILPAELLYLNTVGELDYFAAINKYPVQYKSMIEIKPACEVAALKKQIDLSLAELKASHEQLKEYAEYLDELHRILMSRLNHHHLLAANRIAREAIENTLFSVCGWVPENQVKLLVEAAKHHHVYIGEVAIDPTDIVPTCLQNEGAGRIGEDLVHIYDVPSKDDADPSLWVLFFFALFFSMIVADAGYGLILLFSGLYVQYKYKKLTEFSARMLNLLYILSAGIIVWGILTTSFFGITVAPESPLRKFSLLSWLVEKKAAYHFAQRDAVASHWIDLFPAIKEMSDPVAILSHAVKVDPASARETYELSNAFADNIMLELALFVGVVHIIVSLMRYLKRNVAAIGWIFFIVGGYLYAPSFLGGVSFFQYLFEVDQGEAAKCGLYLMAGGVSFALLANVYKYKLTGVFEVLTSVVQIFSDIMSYLRLYALGLSGSLITATVNEMVDGMNFVLAGVLLVVAHAVNFTLAIMGGVIHGLRLNFLEWYHYSFEGGGKRYDPLKKIELE